MSKPVSELSLEEKLKLVSVLEQRELARCEASFPYYWKNHVRTKDEKDPEFPVKRVPQDKPYLDFLAEEFQNGEDVQYIAKSRQLMISWLLCARITWQLQFRPHSLACFQSKKLEDAARMIFDTTPNVARCSFILANLDDYMKVCLTIKDGERVYVPFGPDTKIFSYGSIKFPNGAIAEALAQGPAQVEGKVPSLYAADEASLQDEWRAAQAAAVPALAKGGRGITVGTMRLPSAYGDEIAPCDEVDPDAVMRGIARFRSASGVSGIRVHYSADPEKDPATEVGRAWFAEETSKMPGGFEGSEWQQHMEISPLAVTGDRVLPFWYKIEPRVVLEADIPPEQGLIWKLDAGLDWGVRNPTVWLVFGNDFEGNRYVLSELATPAGDVGGIVGIVRMMKASPYFSRVNGRIQADPSLWNSDQNTQKGVVSRAQLFAEEGVHLVSARLKGREADDILLARLLGAYWAGHEEMETFQPRLFINPSCTYLVRTLPKLMFAEYLVQHTDKKEQIQSKHADAWDAMKYCEVARPTSAVMPRQGPPPLSFDWFMRQMRAAKAQDGIRRS